MDYIVLENVVIKYRVLQVLLVPLDYKGLRDLKDLKDPQVIPVQLVKRVQYLVLLEIQDQWGWMV
jgi:hypothetical protein